MPVITTMLAVFGCGATPAAPSIDPFPPEVTTELVAEWTFDRDDGGWVPENQCTASLADGSLIIRSTGSDPFFHCPVDFPGGRYVLQMRARSRTAGPGVIYWATPQSRRGEDKTSPFRLMHDGRWHEYEARFVVDGRLADVRIDPGMAPGSFEVDWLRLIREQPHPLTLRHVETTDTHVRFEVTNHSGDPIVVSSSGQKWTLPGQTTVPVDRPVDVAKPLEAVSIELHPDALPPIRRTIFVYHPSEETDWLVRPLPEMVLRIAPDGSVARIERDGQLLAIIGPLVQIDGTIPVMKQAGPGEPLRFQGEGVTLSLSTAGNEISIAIQSPRPCSGPVVRVLGDLEQGLLAGLEYLGKGEHSSSKLDVETDEHLRFAPDPLKVTMPLMAFVTDQSSVAMTWSNMQLQPLFATPNFFDCADDHRMALQGTQITATIMVGQCPLEETIRWAVDKNGLPPLPTPPRTVAQQWKLCLQALEGPLKTEAGWGHCVEARWARQPYADMASTVWRLSGHAPDLNRIVPNGSHIRNGAIYFVTGRAHEWLGARSAQVRGIINRQGADGSFRYSGKYARGHFEDTASGICARPAADLLEFARLTGDRSARDAGLRALEYMKRFRTPRGAQTWEVPLHTPDLLASAYLVWAYVRGYELTGNEEYLAQARKWAVTGVPFVYLWSCHPIMAYATPPVYGATHWRAPAWFGLPVQWVGIVYAYSLTMLAPYDGSLDWNKIARGILIAGEQMQCPDGENAGLLPDVFRLEDQARLPAMINPCALVSLRMALDGQVDAFSVATDGPHRVTAPFPVSLTRGKASVQGKPGVAYQVLVDGQRIVDVRSKGDDVVSIPYPEN